MSQESEFDASGNPAENDPPAAIEDRLQVIAQQFFEAMRSGAGSDRRRIEAAHPELSPWLGRRLKLMVLLHEAALDLERG